MGARPLLRNARHRTMITPIIPPRLRLIHISPSYQTVYLSFEIILEWVLRLKLFSNVHWIGIQIQCSMQTHCFKKTFNLIWIKLKKYLIAEGSSGPNGWARVKSERMYSREPLLRTIFFHSCHLQIARGRPTWNGKHAKHASSRSTIQSVVEGSGWSRVLESPLPTHDLNVFAQRLFPANTWWCWLTCQHSAFHRPTRFETHCDLSASKIDTRISLRCQEALHFIARHWRSTMTAWSRPIIPTYAFWSYFSCWFATMSSNYLKTTQQLRLVFYVQ